MGTAAMYPPHQQLAVVLLSYRVHGSTPYLGQGTARDLQMPSSRTQNSHTRATSTFTTQSLLDAHGAVRAMRYTHAAVSDSAVMLYLCTACHIMLLVCLRCSAAGPGGTAVESAQLSPVSEMTCKAQGQAMPPPSMRAEAELHFTAEVTEARSQP